MTGILDHTILLILDGTLPRDAIDFRPTPEFLDGRYERWARFVERRSFARADMICTDLESQCHELACIESEGLAGRLRFLVAAAIVARAVKDHSTTVGLDQLSFFRTMHVVVEERRISATYDLSNALAALQFRFDTPEDSTLGRWVWMLLGQEGVGVRFRWVSSTMRFATGLGTLIVLAADEISRASNHLSARRRRDIASDDARRIAEAYLRSQGSPRTTIRDVYSIDEIPFRRPAAYGVSLENCWIAYVASLDDAIRSSYIVAIDRSSGAVVYAGSAHDEG